MLFNSFLFWAFFAVVLAVYSRLPHRPQNRFLLVASYVFYGAWDWRFLFLIGLSTLVDFAVGLRLGASDDPATRKRLVAVSAVVNLGLLGVFKYYDFFAAELSELLANFGIAASMPVLGLVLPVGISFYTFQTMSYAIDVYRRETEPVANLLDFALYVSFFPQLVAGPIERSKRLMHQIIRPRLRRPDDFAVGLNLVLYGLWTKVVIADNMAAIVDTVFGIDPSSLTGAEVMIGVWAFAFQIYGDFAGYSSIARGIARFMGFDLMVNFRRPYFARSPSDFWRRWHISLSTWLRDYLYIPLGGNRGSRSKTYRNLLLTMILGGLWHGAAWTFIAWGVFHGIILCLFRLARRPKPLPTSELPGSGSSRPGWLFSTVGMFHLVGFGWLLFRAQSMDQVFVMLNKVGNLASLFDLTPFAIGALGLIAFFVLPLLAYEAWLERRQLDDSGNASLPVQALLYCVWIILLVFFPPPGQHEFIYFQF